MPTFVIDSTAWSSVVRCTRDGCHWRVVTITKSAAYLWLEDHHKRAHDDRLAAKVARQSAHRAS